MPSVECSKCDKSFVKSKADEPLICSECEQDLIQEINQIDRNDDRYTKRGKLKNRLHDIPDGAIPKKLALMIEEVADPEVEDRQFMVGSIDEVKKIGDSDIHSINNDLSEEDRGKVVLKKRHRSDS